jgi:hypothetical protein
MNVKQIMKEHVARYGQPYEIICLPWRYFFYTDRENNIKSYIE